MRRAPLKVCMTNWNLNVLVKLVLLAKLNQILGRD
jgi:hypothetical protein